MEQLLNYWNQISYRLKLGHSAVKRLVLFTSAFYLLYNIFAFLFSLDSLLKPWLILPSQYSELITRPWTFISYMFMHSGILHILFNMLILYFIGLIAESILGPKPIYKVYFYGGLAGALLFIIMANISPLFQGVNHRLLGASAGVMSVAVLAAVYAPDMELRLYGIIPIKLKWLVLVLIVIDLIMIPQSNAGGRIAHLGGAFCGLLYALNLKNQLPFIQNFNVKNPFRFLRSKKKPSFTQNKASNQNQKSRNAAKNDLPNQQEIDAVLDKISEKGYDSLSSKEKEILFKVSK